MEKKVKTTRKTSVAIEKLHQILSHMEYYYKNTSEWKNLLNDFSYIEEHLMELSTDKKVDHAKFAIKFKTLFFKENKKLKEENCELKKEIEELKDDK